MRQHAGGVGDVADAEDHRDRERQRHREADERAEGHDVERGHRPGVLVAEDRELLGDALLHRAERGELHHQQRGDHVQRNRHPHADEAEAGGLRQVQVQAEDRRDERQRVQPGDLGERDDRVAGVRRDRLQVVHAEPAQDRQRHQRQHPGEAGVLDPGRGAGEDLADDPAAVLQQRHRLAADRAEQAHRHHQRDDDLHRRHAEVADARVDAERRALQPLREERADVRHRAREVAAAHARPQRHQLERPQRPVLVLQHDAGADRRRQQHRGGQEDRVAAAGEADQERRRDAHRRAGDAGDRGQREELGLREREAEVQHLHGDDSPHPPDREAAQQRRHRDREVAVGDALAGRLPELVVLGAPVGDVAPAGASAAAWPWSVRCSSSSPCVDAVPSALEAERLGVPAHHLGPAHFGPVHPDQRHPHDAVHQHEAAGADAGEVEQDRRT